MSDENLVQLQQEAKQWAQMEVSRLRGRIRSLSSKGKGDLVRQLKSKTAIDALGVLQRVSFSFPRHGVFFQKGVGRGYIMQGGKVVRGSNPSKETKAYAASKNRVAGKVLKQGSMNRQPQDWFNAVIDQNVPALADIVSKYMADATVNATHMKIN